MKKSIELLSSKIPFQRTASTIFGSFEEAIRAEIFSTARLEGHGESLARAQAITQQPSATGGPARTGLDHVPGQAPPGADRRSTRRRGRYREVGPR